MEQPQTTSPRSWRLRSPHPVTLFFMLTIGVILLTWFAEALGLQVMHPLTQEQIHIQSVLNPEGVRWLLRHVISNFTGFPSFGVILVSLFGLGLVHHSGLMESCFRKFGTYRRTEGEVVWIVLLLSLAGTLIGDAGMILLPPLCALLCQSASIHPVAGLVISSIVLTLQESSHYFMGSAEDLLIGNAAVLDTTTQADGAQAGIRRLIIDGVPWAMGGGLQWMEPGHLYFAVTSIVCALMVIYIVSRKHLIPTLRHLPLKSREWNLYAAHPSLVTSLEQPAQYATIGQQGEHDTLERQTQHSTLEQQAQHNTSEQQAQHNTLERQAQGMPKLSRKERRAFRGALLSGLLYTGVIIWITNSSGGALRSVNGSLAFSPLMESMEFLISVGLGVMGSVYGFLSGRYRTDSDLIQGITHYYPLLKDFFLLLFFMAQLAAIFSYSHLDLYLALKGSSLLSDLTFPLLPSFPLTGFLLLILLTAVCNIFLVSPMAKWGITPLLLLPWAEGMSSLTATAGTLTPEAVECAFRIGDSCTNVLSPFMYYLPFLLVMIRRYSPKATYSAWLSLTWRYSFTLLLLWSLLFALWLLIGLPWGW